MIIILLILSITFLIYSFWFTLFPISSGDWPYLFLENIKEFSWFPQKNFLWLAPYYQILTKFVVQYLGIPWIVTEKIFWFFSFIILSAFSSYKLTKSPLGVLIYLTNTYILMIVGGGQMGVVMAYSLAPFVIKRFIDFSGNLSTGLIIAIQIMFDPRIALLTLIASVFYCFTQNDIRRLLQTFLMPLAVATLLNLYWIIPFLRGELPLLQQSGEATVDAVKFLSFATFEQTISLLHPNWPENIFGKVHFMQAEFLILPILAFSSLLIKKTSIVTKYFVFLGLFGAFLAKGSNPPFGEIYIWLFNHIPGFTLFRDSTKFYLFTAISFSVLIPSTIRAVGRTKLVSIAFILFWAFTIREALLGQLTGTFRPMPVPVEYIRLKDFFVNEPQFFDTLWIPQRQRFGYYSATHPSLDAGLLSKESSISGILNWITKEQMQKELDALHVKYVMVPYDSRGELFLTDRQYDEKLYLETLDKVSRISWLHKINTFLPIGVFELQK